jgi:hypothetical protein
MITGDVHGDFRTFNFWIKSVNDKQKLEYVISCGDFGFWPDYGVYDYTNIKLPDGVKVFWADGNHERHDLLKKFTEITKITDNVFYVPRGKYIEINGKNIMFIGGATSSDKKWRKPEISWFPEEDISESVLYNLPDIKIDVVISHTCPQEFVDQFKHHYRYLFDDRNQ